MLLKYLEEVCQGKDGKKVIDAMSYQKKESEEGKRVTDAKSLQKEEGKKKEKYFKLKEWDSLRKDIADDMKVIGLKGENKDVVGKVIEIAERRLRSNIPEFIKTLK